MVTKYVCLVGGCDFVTESKAAALAHMGSHPEETGDHMAIVGPMSGGGTECSTLHAEDKEDEDESDNG